MVTIGRNITRLMREKNLTLPKLAIRAGMDKGNLYRIVKTGKGYSSESLQGIANALAVPIAALFAEETTLVLPAGVRRIPVIDSARAGAATGIPTFPNEQDEMEHVLTSCDCSSSAFAMRVKDDSMVPDLRPGDLVIVDPEVHPKPGSIVVAVTEGDAFLMRYADRGASADGGRIFELIPSNSLYAALRSDQINVRILGVAMQKVTNLQTYS